MDNLLLRLLAMLAFVSLAAALDCFICNSHNDADCYDMAGDAKSRYLKDCNSLGDEKKVNYTLCRKMHIFIDQDYTETNQEEDRVQRDCGYIDDEELKRSGECYYRSGYNTRTWACSCKDDGCNGATQHMLSGLTFVATVILGAMLRNQVFDH